MVFSHRVGMLAFLLVFLPVSLATSPVRSIWSDQGESDGCRRSEETEELVSCATVPNDRDSCLQPLSRSLITGPA